MPAVCVVTILTITGALSAARAVPVPLCVDLSLGRLPRWLRRLRVLVHRQWMCDSLNTMRQGEVAGGTQVVHGSRRGCFLVIRANPEICRDFISDHWPRLQTKTDNASEFFRYTPALWGSYAYAVVDREAGSVYLASDFLASHPLYYAQNKGSWIWSFELSELRSRLIEETLDFNALDEYMRYQWLMDGRTLISEIKEVPPGHCVCLRPGEPAAVQLEDEK